MCHTGLGPTIRGLGHKLLEKGMLEVIRVMPRRNAISVGDIMSFALESVQPVSGSVTSVARQVTSLSSARRSHPGPSIKLKMVTTLTPTPLMLGP